jgi:hypothetical protein
MSCEARLAGHSVQLQIRTKSATLDLAFFHFFFHFYGFRNQGVVVSSVFKKFSNGPATFRSPDGA